MNPRSHETERNRALSESRAGRLHVGLLGSFRVEGPQGIVPESAWLQRRSAKTLLKLVATDPAHMLHREQIMEMLWRDVNAASARNSFAKALHAARHALEPQRTRGSNTYLLLHDDMLWLDTENVIVDADRFERLATAALERGDLERYEIALAAYSGELLPADRYEDWSYGRRDYLAYLHTKLLRGAAETLERMGASQQAVDHLLIALQHDPANEVIHRQLIRIYAEQGMRGEAVRQFHACRDALKHTLDVSPDAQTVALYEDIVADRFQRRGPTYARISNFGDAGSAPFCRAVSEPPFVGRDASLRLLRDRLELADAMRGGLILLSGEAGVGKTRLVAEFVAEASERGATVLVGGTTTHPRMLPYSAFSLAIESHVASQPDDERQRLADRHRALVRLIPSLGVEANPSFDRAGSVARHSHLVAAIVRLLTDLAAERTVVLTVGDLDAIDPLSLQLLWYLAHLAGNRRWVIVATCREERLDAESELLGALDAAVHQGVCTHMRLPCLPRPECDQLVRAILRDYPVDGVLLDHMFSLTLGNALFVVELARALRECGDVDATAATPTTLSHVSKQVPEAIRKLVESTVSNLEPNVRQVLRLVAAAQGDLTLAELRVAAKALRPSVPAAAFLDALDRALAVQMIEELEGTYSFRHPLVGATLYERLPAHRRLQYEAALRPARRMDGKLSKLTVLTAPVPASGPVARRAEVTQ